MIKQQRVCQKTVNAGQALDMPVGFRFTERAQSSPTHGLSMRVMVRSEDLGLQVLKGASPPRGLDLQAHGWSHQFGPEGRHLGAVLSGAMRLARVGPEPHTMLGSHSSMLHGGCQPDVGNNSKVFVSILVECWEVILVRGPGSLMRTMLHSGSKFSFTEQVVFTYHVLGTVQAPVTRQVSCTSHMSLTLLATNRIRAKCSQAAPTMSNNCWRKRNNSQWPRTTGGQFDILLCVAAQSSSLGVGGTGIKQKRQRGGHTGLQCKWQWPMARMVGAVAAKCWNQFRVPGAGAKLAIDMSSSESAWSPFLSSVCPSSFRPPMLGAPP